MSLDFNRKAVADTLLAVQSHLACVAQHLSIGDPLALERDTAALRQASVDLARHVTEVGVANLLPSQISAISKISESLALNRDILARRAAPVTSALNALVPSTKIATYTGAANRYSGNGRQTGAFKQLAA